MSTKLRVVVEYDVPDETISDMLDAAGYGIGYWASSLIDTQDPPPHIEVHLHQGTVHRCTYLELRAAFGQLVDPDQAHIGRALHEYFTAAVRDRDRTTGVIDAGHIDSDAADVWVQVALFGKVLYG